MRKTIRIRATGADVRFLQEQLRDGGYYGGSIDGIFGPVTLAAVKAFQSANGLNPDGIVGRLTWEILEAGWEDDDPEPHAIPSTIDPPWLAKARSHIGITEIGGSKHNPTIIKFHSFTSLSAQDDETPWCASFACACLEESGITSPKSAAAISFLSWGNKLTTPRIGCIVVMSRPGGNHVGFYVGGDAQTIKILGGNQSNQVKVSSFSKDIVKGYRWPD